MHLVIDHVAELDHVDDTDCRILVKPVTCTSIPEMSPAELRETCLVSILAEFVKACTVENRSAELHAELLACPSENCLVNLSEVHSGRHTERVEDNVHRSSVLEERHILLPDNLGHDTLVSVASGHLVTDSDLPLLGDIYLGELHHTVGKIISDLHFVNRPLVGCGSLLVGDAIVVDEIPDHLIGVGIIGPAI